MASAMRSLRRVFTPALFHELPLDDRLKRGLEASVGAGARLTPVQKEVIPRQLASLSKPPDLLLQAETGTGKTIAFLLPMLQSLLARDKPPEGVKALVLAPTRELVLQLAPCLPFNSF